MKKTYTIIAATMVILSLASICRGEKEASVGKADIEKQHAAAIVHAVYVCADCHKVAMAAGKCSMCDKDLKQAHLLGVKDGKAALCDCAATCKCDSAGVSDAKCSCGKEVKEMSLKGLHGCPAGCPVIADKGGKCAGCSKELAMFE